MTETLNKLRLIQAETPTLNKLRLIQAESMLAEFPIYAQLVKLKNGLTYRDMPVEDYFVKLQEQADNVGVLQLRHSLDEADSSSYLIDVTMGYERVMDGLAVVVVNTTAFLSNLKATQARVKALQAPFQVYWSVGAADIISDTPLKKLNAGDLKALANFEFSTASGEVDLVLAAIIDGTEVLLDNLKAQKKLAADKYAMAKDQVNALLASMDIPDRGTGDEPQSHQPNTAKILGDRYGSRVKVSDMQTGSQADGQELDTDDDLPPSLREVVDLDTEAAELPRNGGIASEAEEEHFLTVEAKQKLPKHDRHSVERVPARGVPTTELRPEALGVFSDAERADTPAQAAADALQLILTHRTETPVAGQEVLGAVDLNALLEIVDEPGPGPLSAVIQLEDDVPGPTEESVAVTQLPEEVELHKPAKGEALVIPYNMCIDFPGFTPKVQDFLIGKGKTKFALTNQTKPEENGVYRWHGPNDPMTRLEEALKAPKAEVQPEPAAEPEAPVEATLAPPTEVTTIVPTDDPFSATKVTTGVRAVELDDEPQGAPSLEPGGMELDDDFPTTTPATPTNADLDDDFPMTTSTPQAAPDEDDDFPTTAPVTPPPAEDEDDDFPLGAPIVDKTPASTELAEKAGADKVAPSAEAASAPTPAPAPAPTPAPAAAAKPPAVTKPVGSLFRPRTPAAGQTMAPAFKAPVGVSNDSGLDEVL